MGTTWRTDDGHRLVHNPHDLVGEDIPIAVYGHGSHGDTRLVITRHGQEQATKIDAGSPVFGNDRSGVVAAWEKLKRSTQIAEWQYVPTMDAYVPADADLSDLRTNRGLGADPKLVRVKGKPVEFAPCGLGMARDEGRWTSFSTCWRPRETADGFCPMHRKVNERAATKAAEDRARWDAIDEARNRGRENKRRATEAVVVLRAALEPLGILPDTITADEHVQLPAEVAEAVAQWLTEYDELRNM